MWQSSLSITILVQQSVDSEKNTYATISGASENCESFRKKWSTQEVFIKPAIHLQECHSIVYYAVFVYL